MSDQDIIEGFLAGRKEEHDILSQWIKQVAYRRLHMKRVSADEIVSDTMYKLLTNFRSESFQLREKLKSYVQAVAAYTVIDHGRYWRRYSDLTEEEQVNAPDPGSIEQDIQAKDDQLVIARIFGLMSEECRKLWRLRFVDDFDYEEIGKRLGISEGTVKVRFHRCKKQAIAIRERIT